MFSSISCNAKRFKRDEEHEEKEQKKKEKKKNIGRTYRWEENRGKLQVRKGRRRRRNREHGKKCSFLVTARNLSLLNNVKQ